MNLEDKLPTPYDLMPVPQFAILSVLERTLEMVVRTLLAQHPMLFDHEKPYWIRADLASVMAEEILSDIDSLCKSLQGYQYMLSTEMEPDPLTEDSFPF